MKRLFRQSRNSLVTGIVASGLIYITVPPGATGDSRDTDGVFSALNASFERCLQKASRPGFPYYNRPEAVDACNQTKTLLQDIGRGARQARNLACSSRVPALEFNIWMVQFLGNRRMSTDVMENLRQLKRNCYNAL